LKISTRQWILTATVSLFCCGLVLAADETAKVEGRVVNKGAGVGAVLVLINELKLTAETDATGSFTFPKVPLGSIRWCFRSGTRRTSSRWSSPRPGR
jgi:hypothetical protein